MSIDMTKLKIPNFEVLSLLGRGGMASVWKARQISLDRPVAIKVLSSAFTTDPEDVKRFLREARMAARLKHAGIVQVYDANFSDGIYYFVMELVDGYTMGELQRRKGRVSVDDALIIAESVALALDYAWSEFQMVHCDIKPDNIMADADGSVKVTDLGLSHSLTLIKEQEEGQKDEILGTPAYMSPEQVYGVPKLDCRSDIYSLGATLYHMITGRMLFQDMSDDDVVRCHVERVQAPDPSTLTSTVRRPLALLLERMLAKDRERRHSDWKAVLWDIRRVLSNQLPKPVVLPPMGSSVMIE